VLTREEYNHWLAVAARHARKRGEAEDLLHDSLLAAVEARRTDLSDAPTRGWFAGLIRNKAMMDARSAARRKRRETAFARGPAPPAQPTLSAPADDVALKLVRSLPPATRAVATLALHGMTRREIAFVLDLSDAALRQRLATLKRRWAGVSESAREDAVQCIRDRRRSIGQEMELGQVRRALLALVREVPGIGTHDPDGHLIMFEKPAPPPSPPSRSRRSRQR
jgi:RNA polymerase sigma-70 factor (ECF subfamily)